MIWVSCFSATLTTGLFLAPADMLSVTAVLISKTRSSFQRLIETAPWGDDSATIDQQLISQQKFHNSIQMSVEVDRARDDLVGHDEWKIFGIKWTHFVFIQIQ